MRPVLTRAQRGALALVLATAAFPAGTGAQAAPHAGHAAPPAAAADTAERLGEVHFPTSAKPAAHAEFLRGVRYLHNFHYPQAVAAFRRARAVDPDDAMSAAFEAIAHTHPVWNEQDTAAARAALRRLAPTRAERLTKARTPRERAWLGAAEALYEGDAPKAARDTAFSRALAALHASDPAEPEAATFYALSLLGLNQGDREPRAYAAAEAVSDTVRRAHPRHPGALHYLIHAVDDPPNAARGMDAARAYGQIATSAGHALHMTSHIYIALGLWDDVVRANRQAQATSPHVFGHGTHWLSYGLVQQGRVREARAWVDSMLGYQREVAAGAPARRGRADVDIHAILMTASYVVDAEAWDAPLARLRLDTTHLPPLMATHADFLVGYAAARRAGRGADLAPGSRAADRRLADSMLARLTARHARARAAGGGRASALGEAKVMEQVLRAELAVVAGRRDSAVAILRAAGARLEALPFAFGPPATVVLPRERAGELLLSLGRPAEALTEFDGADRLAPKRASVTTRRARALDALGRRAEAARVYDALAAAWTEADADFPYLAEVRRAPGAAGPPQPPADTSAAAVIRAAYARIERGMRARDSVGLFDVLAPDATHQGLGRPMRTRAQFVGSVPAMFSALDTLHAFTIVVDSVRVAGDSATAWYHERMAATFRPRSAGAAAERMDNTSWWADRWVRTAAGWRLVRLEEVPAPR